MFWNSQSVGFISAKHSYATQTDLWHKLLVFHWATLRLVIDFRRLLYLSKQYYFATNISYFQIIGSKLLYIHWLLWEHNGRGELQVEFKNYFNLKALYLRYKILLVEPSLTLLDIGHTSVDWWATTTIAKKSYPCITYYIFHSWIVQFIKNLCERSVNSTHGSSICWFKQESFNPRHGAL